MGIHLDVVDEAGGLAVASGFLCCSSCDSSCVSKEWNFCGKFEKDRGQTAGLVGTYGGSG